jgi:hypothetical protein
MELIPNWRDAWRWFSVQALIVIAALPVIWSALPPDTKALVPEGWEPWIFFALAIAGVIGRLIDQNRTTPA